MLFGTYRYYCRLENDAELPFYKGSTFRGVFGRALKKVVCALKLQECGECLLRQRCIYTQVFETELAQAPAANARVIPPPHPFVIEPPETNQTFFPAGSKFDFSLLLFGKVNQAFPYFLYSFDQMGRIGIGRKINGERGRFGLESVECNGDIVYTSEDQRLKTTNGLQTLRLEAPPESHEHFKIKITIETPLRLKFENRFRADLPFHVFVRGMLRRTSSLLATYGDGEPDIDYKGLVKRAETVRIAASDLSWFDWRRYSFRQDKDMLMGGIVGSVTYEGGIGEFLPLLDFCAKVHLGKQTAFGLGKFTSERVP
ncbi:MAG: CRISPR system precrRNA processing endoribonuclease RAMP protein Cas6 [Thermodesulfobacteriota bacterium]